MKMKNDNKSIFGNIVHWIIDEFKTIGTSYPILLVLMGGIFVYGLLYNYMYEPNDVKKAPVAVVDNSRSDLSRKFTQMLNATPQVSIYTNNVDYAQAQDLMKENKIVGILLIPDDFDTRINSGEQSVFMMYETTTAFLYYLALQKAASFVMLNMNDQLRPDQLVFLPTQTQQSMAQSQATISVIGTPLYNYTEGYGTYLIPAVLMVIIFQTLMMVIAMISGDERDTRSIVKYKELGKSFGGVSQIIIAKTFVYCILYAIFAFFLLGLMPVVFDLPNIGNFWEIVQLLIPFLLATSFFGLACSLVYTGPDAPLLMIAFFSVGLIFLSGVSYPLELMPWYWRMMHFVIPAAPGTLAFVKINSMGASMSEIAPEYITLWIQCIVYFILACLSYRYNIRKYGQGTNV